MTRQSHRALLPTGENVRAGRHFVATSLTRWGLNGHVDTATLLASEAMTNAVVHAATPFVVDLCLDLDRRELVVAVTDLGTRPVLDPITSFGLQTLLAEPDLDADSGWGLMIIATLADRWGIDPAPPGKTVWFALDLPPRHGTRGPGQQA